MLDLIIKMSQTLEASLLFLLTLERAYASGCWKREVLAFTSKKPMHPNSVIL
jgi:hypothetical protein